EQDYEDWKGEFSERILETWARYCPNMTKTNIIAQYAYTGREYVQELPNMTRRNVIGKYIYTADEYAVEFPNMRNGDIFMGAFNAEQVMYNHFGYRTTIPNLYYAGSAAHCGGAISGGPSYVAAGIIARDLGLKPWWTPWSARYALEAMAKA
ncbi:MAG TPA: hypothetical protein VGH49_12490, partial [Xanthobacteraceae bacterium]